MGTMRGFFVGGLLVCLALVAGCKKRFDGTCKTNGDCLEFQKCASGVCVRAKPLFEAYVSPPVPEAPPRKKTTKPSTQEPPAEAPEDETKPADKTPPRPNLGPAVPKTPRDPATARRFRLDA